MIKPTYYLNNYPCYKNYCLQSNRLTWEKFLDIVNILETNPKEIKELKSYSAVDCLNIICGTTTKHNIDAERRENLWILEEELKRAKEYVRKGIIRII